MDDALKRALSTPPQPHKSSGKSTASPKRKERKSDWSKEAVEMKYVGLVLTLILVSGCVDRFAEEVQATRHRCLNAIDREGLSFLAERAPFDLDKIGIDQMVITEKPTTKELDALQRLIPISESCKNDDLKLIRSYRPEFFATGNQFYARHDKLYTALLHGDLTWGEFNILRREIYADLLIVMSRDARSAEALKLQRLQTLDQILPKTTTSSCFWVGYSLECSSQTY